MEKICYDIIGDIHGYADTLKALLEKLGYGCTEGYYKHPERMAVFVGDFVDRGPAIRECLQIIKAMVDNGSALAVMGNHEYNAIAFNTKTYEGNTYLRPHSKRNISLHRETIDAFVGLDDEWQEYLEWMKALPLYLDLGPIRIVHACWDENVVKQLNDRLTNAVMDEAFLLRSGVPGTFEYNAIETLLKGYEVYLPPGFHYKDRDGNTRTKIRVRWWKSFKYETYRSISLSKDEALPNEPIPNHKLKKFSSYSLDKKPIFIGHYWNSGKPVVLKANVCCVDYSIAKKEKLVAYRWDGEEILNNDKFIEQVCVEL